MDHMLRIAQALGDQAGTEQGTDLSCFSQRSLFCLAQAETLSK